MRIKLILMLVMLSFLFSLTFVRAENEVCVYLFYGKTCPHCAEEKVFLKSLEEKYPELEVKQFEVYYDQANQELFEKISRVFNTISSGVPMTFIDGKAFIGFTEGDMLVYHPDYRAYIGYSKAIENAIEDCIDRGGCDCPSEDVVIEEPSGTNQTGGSVPITPIQDQTFVIPIVGEISSELPILLTGVLLGLIDGAFNPCALSVLFFLISYLMALGSRSKCLKLGLVYAIMIFIVYSFFMILILKGMGSAFILGAYKIVIKILVVIMFVAGFLQIKDFFFYGRGISLEIPKFTKPTIENLIKRGTTSSAFILGILVSFVEIPCSGIFPLAYTAILSFKFSEISSIFYVFWYNIFFVLPLIILVTIFYLGLMQIEKAEKTRLKVRKYMRLVSGIIMISLALWLLSW